MVECATMPKKTFIVLSLSLLNVGLRAAFMSEVDVISLGRPETDVAELGWRVTSVSNYGESYRNALRFNVKESQAVARLSGACDARRPADGVLVQRAASAEVHADPGRCRAHQSREILRLFADEEHLRFTDAVVALWGESRFLQDLA